MRKLIAIATIGAALTLLHPTFGSTSAMYSQSTNNQSNQFAGATFSPTVAPVVSLTSNANGISLSWSRVTISSGATVSYVVIRTTAGAQPTQVCTGVDVPVLTGNQMTCSDPTALTGVPYSYTEQPVVVVSTSVTWSLSPSAASATACVKKCR